MIMYVYAYRNRKINAGSIPQYHNIDKEHFAEGVKRQLLTLTDANKKAEMADLELVYLGTYDDIAMVHTDVDGGSELLLTCSDYIQLDKE